MCLRSPFIHTTGSLDKQTTLATTALAQYLLLQMPSTQFELRANIRI